MMYDDEMMYDDVLIAGALAQWNMHLLQLALGRVLGWWYGRALDVLVSAPGDRNERPKRRPLHCRRGLAKRQPGHLRRRSPHRPHRKPTGSVAAPFQLATFSAPAAEEILPRVSRPTHLCWLADFVE